MEIKTAIRNYLIANVTGLNCYLDASDGNTYPFAWIKILASEEKAMGANLWDCVANDSDSVKQNFKVIEENTTVRFTVKAVADGGQTGNQILDAKCTALRDLLFETARENPKEIQIPDTDPVQNIRILSVSLAAMADNDPVTTQTPNICSRTMDFNFKIHRVYSKAASTDTISTMKLPLPPPQA